MSVRVYLLVIDIESSHVVVLSHDVLMGKSSGCALQSVGAIRGTCLEGLAVRSDVRGAHACGH